MRLWLFVLQIFSRAESSETLYCRRENQFLPDCPLGRRIADCPLKGDCAAAETTSRH